MSHIPNSVMPHAVAAQSEEKNGHKSAFSFGGARDKAREYPKSAIAAGAALVIGGIAAAAFPAFRSRIAGSDAKKSPKRRASAKNGSGAAKS